MPNAYLVEIHRFLVAKKKGAKRGLKEARTAEEKAYYRGVFDEVDRMEVFVSEKYDMNFYDYGEAL